MEKARPAKVLTEVGHVVNETLRNLLEEKRPMRVLTGVGPSFAQKIIYILIGEETPRKGTYRSRTGVVYNYIIMGLTNY